MSSYADIRINGFNILEWQNTYETWYFSDSDRVRLLEEDFYGYRTDAKTLKRRLNLAGYTRDSMEIDFNELRQIWINELTQLTDYLSDADAHGYLYPETVSNAQRRIKVLKEATIEQWLNALPKARDYPKHAFFEDLEVEDNELLTFMLSTSFDPYPNYSAGGYHFPCRTHEHYALAILEFTPEDSVCELNITELIHSGWVDDFDDLAEIQNKQTKFFEQFTKSKIELLQLSYLLKDNTRQQQMVFAGLITEMEAYLANTLKKQIFTKHGIRRRFVEHLTPNHKDNRKSFNFSEIFKKFDFLEQAINQELDLLSFHNINTAKDLYKNVLLTEFPNEHLSSLYKAVFIRHDIVHRAGKNTDGEAHTLTHTNVEELAELINKVLIHLDKQIIDGLIV